MSFVKVAFYCDGRKMWETVPWKRAGRGAKEKTCGSSAENEGIAIPRFT
ncbi:hypothetical protein ABE218_01685 [Bacillus smithii]